MCGHKKGSQNGGWAQVTLPLSVSLSVIADPEPVIRTSETYIGQSPARLGYKYFLEPRQIRRIPRIAPPPPVHVSSGGSRD